MKTTQIVLYQHLIEYKVLYIILFIIIVSFVYYKRKEMYQRLLGYKLFQHLWRYKRYYFVGFLLIIFISISPILFTKWSWYDLAKQDFSYIGEAIGGITAPIIGIISGLLIFFTFLKQNKFNEQQIINNDRDTLLNFFRMIKEDINKLLIKEKENENRYKGIGAISYYTIRIKNDYNNAKVLSLKLEMLENFRTFNVFLTTLKEYNSNNKHKIVKDFVLSYYNNLLIHVLAELLAALENDIITDVHLKEIKNVIIDINSSINNL